MPRNDSVASNVTAVGMYSVASTSTGPSRFGRMSRNMIRIGRAPSDLAASTYSFSLSDSVWPRTIREMPAQEKKEITPITIVRLGWNTAASASARMMNGKARAASKNRARIASTTPPKYPAIRPSVTPATVAIAVVSRPTNSEQVPADLVGAEYEPMDAGPDRNAARGLAPQRVSLVDGMTGPGGYQWRAQGEGDHQDDHDD